MTGAKVTEMISKGEIKSVADAKKCGKKACVEWLQQEGIKKLGIELSKEGIASFMYMGKPFFEFMLQIINKK